MNKKYNCGFNMHALYFLIIALLLPISAYAGAKKEVEIRDSIAAEMTARGINIPKPFIDGSKGFVIVNDTTISGSDQFRQAYVQYIWVTFENDIHIHQLNFWGRGSGGFFTGEADTIEPKPKYFWGEEPPLDYIITESQFKEITNEIRYLNSELARNQIPRFMKYGGKLVFRTPRSGNDNYSYNSFYGVNVSCPRIYIMPRKKIKEIPVPCEERVGNITDLISSFNPVSR